jgi:serine/threonine protein kinase
MSFLSDRQFDHLRRVTSEPDLSGTRYRIEHEIGRGGMGIVYRAWDSTLERSVALKVIDDGSVAEAKVLAALEHPGLVPVYDAGTLPDGRCYYAMRLVRGIGFDEFLRREGSLVPRLRMFQRICEAVAFAHDRGVIHCDLKPQNLMTGSFGELLVMDWGIARPQGQMATAGTPRYMAPETTVDYRADIFALGKILEDLMPTPRPRALAAIAACASAADPGRRYGTATELAADIARFLDHQSVSAYRENTLERVSRFARRNQVLLLLLATYLVVKVALFLVGWASRPVPNFFVSPQ